MLIPRAFLAAIAAIAFIGSVTPSRADDLAPVLADAMRGTQTPAMAVLVMQDGTVSETAVQGKRRSDGTDHARADDVWHIGSDGKAMTATLIAKLVDRGVLSWETPLGEMLPDLAGQMRPEYRPMTLKQLLSHHAGLPHDVSDMKFFNAFYADSRPTREQRVAYITRALQDAPVAVPGTTFSYSNTGLLIAAAVAERATGSTYEELMRREVFQPLGMTSVGFGATHDGQPIGHNGGKPLYKETDSNPLFYAPAGNMYLTLQDWARFCLDQMEGTNGRGRLMKPESYRIMQTVQPSGGTSGLGWGIQDTISGRQGPVLTHAGSDGNWYAVAALFPRTRNGLLVTANAGEDMGGDKAVMAAMKAILPSLSPTASTAKPPQSP